jgi:drug/metabolite transporter (DMT)-like permease
MNPTFLGLGAIALWAALAALTAYAGRIPPFQLSAMTFAVGTLVGLAWAVVRRESLATLRSQPAGAWALGVYGLLGFHGCYFFALQNAPPLEASLIVYLWPLLIVIFATLLPPALGGRRLTTGAALGAALGFGGTVLLLLDASGRPEFSGSALGYVLALAAAIIWSSYSVASRLFRDVPSITVIGSCAATTIGSLALHLSSETTTWPTTIHQWLAILGLGLGPVGLAFYLWDEGMKRGSIRVLGVASYATPIVSTAVMAALGLGRLTWAAAAAAVLVSIGAWLASHDA